MKKSINIYAFYIVIFITIVALSITYNELDYDLFSRLIMGKSVLLTGKPMFQDIVSYSPTYIWHDHEWLFSAFIYFIAKFFGCVGLTLLKATLFFLSFFCITLAVKEYNKKETPYNYFLYLVYIANIVCSEVIVSTVRCQLLSYIIIPVWILLLEKIRNGKTKYAYILPFIMLFWLNSHGASIAGIGILIIYALGEALNKKPFKIYLILTVVSLMLFLINPWGLSFLKFMFNACFVNRSYIGEWRPSFGPLAINLSVYKTVLFAVIIGTLAKLIKIRFNPSKIDFVKLFMMLLTAHISISHIKHIMIFMPVVLIYYYEDFYNLYNYLISKISLVLKIKKSKYFNLIKNTITISVLLIYSFVLIILNPINEVLWKKLNETYPVDALRFMQVNNIKGNVLATYFVSGYLAYKGYPDIKIFMDGRQEQLYPQKYIFMNINFYFMNKHNSFDILEQYKPDIILSQINWPVAAADEELSKYGYTKIYHDGNYVIFALKDKYKEPFTNAKKVEIDHLDNIFDTKILEK